MTKPSFASRIRDSLETTDSRSKLVTSLIASVLASDEPLIVAIDRALTLHGLDLTVDAQMGIETAMRIETMRDALSPQEARLLLKAGLTDDRIAISIANAIASCPMAETAAGFALPSDLVEQVRIALRAWKDTSVNQK